MKSDRLNILVLHRLGDPLTWREAMVDKELCLPKFAPDHNYVVHDFWRPMPEYIQDIAFDAIVLTQTFLGARVDPGMRKQLIEKYQPILSCNFFKIALPQDDYKCNEILDRWLIDWDVDLNFPVCVNDWALLYPEYSLSGRMKQGYTGYISDALLQRTINQRPIVSRQKDIAYRATNLSPACGRLGEIKTKYGDRFYEAAQGLNLVIDVSTRPKDIIRGPRWYDFIQDTRCMLGTNSGSSLLDPDGSINQRVFRYQLLHPNATFEEVEAACFPGLDGRHVFTAISPRNIECALFGTTQILAPGAYGNFLEPWEEYIPLEPDMSNFSEVGPLLSDYAYLQVIAERCREKILSYSELRYSSHVSDLIEEIRANTHITDTQRECSVPLIKRYQEESAAGMDAFWYRRRMITRTREFLGDLGLRRIKYLAKGLLSTNGIG